MTTWQRKRKPDAVPTPVAVALSDYCRRGGASASAQEVRDALSTLADDEDFRVQELADNEPDQKGLGPFGVIDRIRGASMDLAQRRQGAGYYALVRELLEVRDQKTIEVPVPTPVPVAAPARAAEAAASAGKAKKEKAQSVAEKIAPKKREPKLVAVEDLDEEKPLLPFQERQLNNPKPRGRFARVDTTKRKIEELYRTSAKAEIEAQIEQRQNRASIARALAESYQGRRGAAISSFDVVDIVRTHNLMRRLEEAEREQLVAAVSEHRGALGRVGWALGITPDELTSLLNESGLKREVEEVRERFRREALSPRNLTLRLDLLGREKYLADLGIKKRFSESLAGDLRKLFREDASGDQPLHQAVEEVARKHAAPSELIQRAIDKLGLSDELERILSDESQQPEA